VESVSWTDLNNPSAKAQWTWNHPDTAMAVCEESQIALSIGRAGPALALNYQSPLGMDFVMDGKQIINGGLSDLGANGVFTLAGDIKALRSVIRVRLLPAGNFIIPSDAVVRFAASANWANTYCLARFLKTGGTLAPQDGLFKGMDCQGMQIASGGNAGVSMTLNVLHADVSAEAGAEDADRTGGDVNRPEMIQVTGSSSLQLISPGLEREVEILFYADGRKKARIKDRMASPDSPLEFDLRENNG
jgi:hypothetical protein